MSRPAERHYTVEDYFSIEEASPVKHEYFDGEIFAMTGASLNHNRIAGNLYSALRTRLQGSPCETFGGDLRLRTPEGLLTYPDVMVLCGGVQLSGADRLDTVLNPVVIFEVLSRSTRDYDRGQKFRLYRQIPTLREYLLVEQEKVLVDLYSRPAGATDQAGDWPCREYLEPGAVLRLESLDVAFPLSEVYAGVDVGTD